jgi:hypothetical protein
MTTSYRGNEFSVIRQSSPSSRPNQHRGYELENLRWGTATPSSRYSVRPPLAGRRRRCEADASAVLVPVRAVVVVELLRRVVLLSSSSSSLSSKLSVRFRESIASSESRSSASNDASRERLPDDLLVASAAAAAAEECDGSIEARALDDSSSTAGECARRRLIDVIDRMILLLRATIVSCQRRLSFGVSGSHRRRVVDRWRRSKVFSRMNECYDYLNSVIMMRSQFFLGTTPPRIYKFVG